MKKIMFYLVLLSLMAACKHLPQPSATVDPLPPPPKVVNCDSTTRDPVIAQKLIVGKWIWVYSLRYNRRLGYKEILTPANYRNNVKDVMEFDAYGKLNFYEDGKLTAQSTYQFRKYSDFSNISSDSTIYLFNQPGRSAFYRICPDSLYLPFQSFGYDVGQDEVWAKH
jgi:hypothetical protein